MSLLLEFQSRKAKYESLMSEISRLLTNLLSEKNIRYQKIEERVKSEESLTKKASKPGKNYQSLENITDIVGLRIIVFFETEVDQVLELLEREFEIDRANSIDKRKNPEPTQFGYRSVHVIVALPERRLALSENSKFTGIHAEIQVRTILQHGWAEIEHDLGYKYDDAPEQIKRRFARAACFLEAVDEEFTRIKYDLAEHKRQINLNVVTPALGVRSVTDEREIDVLALREYLKFSETVRELDDSIAATHGANVADEINIDERDLNRLFFFDVRKVTDLHALLLEKANIIKAFSQNILANRNAGDIHFSRGVCILYLCYVLAAALNDERRIFEYVKTRLFDDTELSTKPNAVLDSNFVAKITGLVGEIRRTYKQAMRSLQ